MDSSQPYTKQFSFSFLENFDYMYLDWLLTDF
jgi:hypothetical protein